MTPLFALTTLAERQLEETADPEASVVTIMFSPNEIESWTVDAPFLQRSRGLTLEQAIERAGAGLSIDPVRTMTTHECPAPGCSTRVQFEQLACRPHWYAIPTPVRSRLSRMWRSAAGSDEYFRARADCLQALGVPADEIPEQNAGVA
jgi:hypothetical protein